MIGDNVFWLTLGIIALMVLAVLGIILNILIHDGPNVQSELNFLEGLVGTGSSGMAILNGFHTYLAHRRKIAGKE